MAKKIAYEENPWGEDAPGKLVPVKDFLPSASEFRKLRLRTEKAEGLVVPITEKEHKQLEKQARKVGLTAEGLLAGIVRDYVQQLPSAR